MLKHEHQTRPPSQHTTKFHDGMAVGSCHRAIEIRIQGGLWRVGMVVSAIPTYDQPAKDDERGAGCICVGLHDSTNIPRPENKQLHRHGMGNGGKEWHGWE